MVRSTGFRLIRINTRYIERTCCFLRSMTERQRKILKITAFTFGALPFVCFSLAFLAMSIAASRKWTEIVSDKSRLPKAMLALERDFPDLRVEYHRVKSGFDLSMTDRGYLRIDGRDCVKKFIDIASLEKTDGKHPRRNEFNASLHLLPSLVVVDGDVWFASPGFGTVHQEIVDLYLLRTTEDFEQATVYHYWTF